MLNAQTRFIPKTDFEREHWQKGRHEGMNEGRAEGMAKAILAFLGGRGLTISEEQRSRILACKDADKLELLIERAVSAPSVAELLTEL